MKKFKFAIAAMVIAVGVIGAFAFSNADEKETVQNVYYITGETTLNGQPAYSFDTTPRDCEGTEMPCQIESEAPLTSPVLQSEVDGPNVEIVSLQPAQ